LSFRGEHIKDKRLYQFQRNIENFEISFKPNRLFKYKEVDSNLLVFSNVLGKM